MKYTKDQQAALNQTSLELQKSIDSLRADDLTDLKAVLTYHEWRYYVLVEPIMTDYDYDMLYKKLEQIEAENPSYVTSDSPTQRVSNDLTEEFKNVPHIIPMLSLDNSYNADDLKKFDEQIQKLTGETNIEYVVEPKYDGGSIAVIFENDMLTRGATRGNGTRGEEMTPNARTIKTIPLNAEFSKFGFQKVELRGEAVIRKDVFAELNKAREAEGLTILANPRNSAAGGLRTKDPKETARRHIEAFIFQFGYGVDADGQDHLPSLGNHYRSIKVLSELGFKVPTKEKKLCKTIEEVADFCAEWEAKRDTYEYEIDGMVVKVNRIDLQEKCGSTSHHPRWAIAYKFKAKQAVTKLLDVEYQIGKIGSITPVAKVEPTALAGVTVSSISLHNEDFIVGKDIRIGDSLLIERAGDVIPYIAKSLSEMRDGSERVIDFPKNCPSCDTLLVRTEGEAAWRCPNNSCEAQLLQRMIFHVSKDAMDIDGFGEKYVVRFHELGWLKSLADIYRLDYEAIANLEGFGQKSADKVRKSIDKAKSNPIRRVLYGLAIHHFGKRASKLIAERIKHVMELRTWTEEEFVAIKDIGPVVAQNVVAFFAIPDNLAMLEEMEMLGVNMEQTEEDAPLIVAEDAPLAGKTILFTGSLQQMGRKEAQKLAEAAGAKNISAVSGNLNILVAGEKAGSKLKKAEALGTVEIMTEEAFLALVR